MIDSNNSSVPTTEEAEIYFNGLPVLDYDQRRFAPQMLVMSDSVDGKSDTLNPGEIKEDSPAIIAFADGVSPENRSAVKLSVAFAETVADRKGDINQDPIQWLTDYAEAMRYSGWATTGGHEYGEYTTSDKSLTMDSVVLELIGAVAGPNKIAILKLLGLVLDKLQKDEPLMKLFESNSKKGSTATFRIMPCVESSGGTPVTYLLSMHCVFSKDSGGTLFWKWSVSKLQIRRLVKGIEFNRELHDSCKKNILDYLKRDADDFFQGLK